MRSLNERPMLWCNRCQSWHHDTAMHITSRIYRRDVLINFFVSIGLAAAIGMLVGYAFMTDAGVGW